MGWLNWTSASKIFCDHKIPSKLNGKLYRVVIKPAVPYGSKCLAIKKQNIQKMRGRNENSKRELSAFTKS